MLNIAKQDESVEVEIIGTKFQLKVLGILEREQWIYDHCGMGKFSEHLKHISKLIISIDGHDDKPFDVLSKMKNLSDVKAMIKGVVANYSLMEQEAKNSDSSSDSDITDNSNDVVSDVDEVKESVLKEEIKPN